MNNLLCKLVGHKWTEVILKNPMLYYNSEICSRCGINKPMSKRYGVRIYCNMGDSSHYRTVYTDSWIEFMWLRISKKIVYYTVRP